MRQQRNTTLLTFRLLNLRDPKFLKTWKQLEELEQELFERFMSGYINKFTYDHLWRQVDQQFRSVPNA